MRTPLLAVALTSAALLPAQRTWHTDPPNLPATVAAAAPGDVVIVSGQGFVFPPLAITKPLAIHGRPGASMTVPSLQISGIAQGQTVTLQGFGISGSANVSRCAGTVLLADLTGTLHVTIEDSLDVSLESCRLDQPLTGSSVVALNSSLTVAQSQIRGLSFGRGSPGEPRPAVAAANSLVRVVQSQLAGGSSVGIPPSPQPAVQLVASTLRLSGAGASLTAGGAPSVPVSAIDGSGTLVVDPAAQLVPSLGAAAVGAGITVVQRAHPTTTVTPSPIGGSGSVRLRGGPGDVFVLLLGAPALATSHPGVHGELRIGAHLTIVTGGVLDRNGDFSVAYGVPAIPALRAIVFRWQGVTSNALATFVAEPATECHR